MSDKSSIYSLFIKPLAVALCLALVLSPLTAEAKSKKSKKAPYVPPYAHMVLDADTGIVISQNNADQALYPASLTKLMTLLMTFEALDAKKISLSSPVVMTSHAANMPPSRIGIRPGTSLSVSNAIKALVTKSANDVAVALGEKLGGSESRFAQMMTAKAHQIGMKQTNFVNASGLHNSKQRSSARDMAKLALYILRQYPHYYSFFSLEEFYFNGKAHHNHNRLMGSYRGMDGMKTGYISQSGFNLVASAKRDGVRLIGVVFGGKTANSRNAQMASLLDDGFSRVRGLRQMRPQTAAMRPVEPVAPFTQAAPAMRQTGQILTPTAPAEPPSGIIPPRKPQDMAQNSVQAPAMQSSGQSRTTTPTARQQSFLASPSSPRAPQTLGTLPAPTRQAAQPPVQVETPAMPMVGWSVQIGAFQDRSSTDQALYTALQKLPAPLNRGTALIVPLRTADATWVFRARIGGYTKEQALQACRYLEDCLTISPTAN